MCFISVPLVFISVPFLVFLCFSLVFLCVSLVFLCCSSVFLFSYVFLCVSLVFLWCSLVFVFQIPLKFISVPLKYLPKPAALVALQYMHVANKEYTDGDLGESKSSNNHAKSRSGEIECSRWNQSELPLPSLPSNCPTGFRILSPRP